MRDVRQKSTWKFLFKQWNSMNLIILWYPELICGIQRPKPSSIKKQLFLHLSQSHPPIRQPASSFRSSKSQAPRSKSIWATSWTKVYSEATSGMSWWNQRFMSQQAQVLGETGQIRISKRENFHKYWVNTGYEIHKYSCKWHNQTVRLSPH